MPLNVKLTLLGLIVYSAYSYAIKLKFAITDDWFVYLFSTAGQLNFCISAYLFILIHWQFASHYLKAACLLEVSLQVLSGEYGCIDKLRQR